MVHLVPSPPPEERKVPAGQSSHLLPALVLKVPWGHSWHWVWARLGVVPARHSWHLAAPAVWMGEGSVAGG